MNESPHPAVGLAAIFEDRARATRFVEQLVEQDFPMDRISLLHQGGGLGDDPIGIVYDGAPERIRVWGEQGALWGALGGLLAGLSGVFLVPGLGAVLAAGPVVNALVGALTGAALMAGAAGVTGVTVALRRLGIPEDVLHRLESAIRDGRYVLLVHTDDPSDGERLEARLRLLGADVLRLDGHGGGAPGP